jgi:hypothetical protein
MNKRGVNDSIKNRKRSEAAVESKTRKAAGREKEGRSLEGKEGKRLRGKRSEAVERQKEGSDWEQKKRSSWGKNN